MAVLAAVLAAWPVLPLAAEPNSAPAPVAEATDARISGDRAATSFELTMTSGVTAEVYTLANPYRVIVDLPDLSFRLKPGAGKQAQGLVAAFRYGLFAERKARVVIDTVGPVRIASAKMTRAEDGKAIVLAVGLEPMEAAAFGLGTGAQRPEDAAKAADAAPAPAAAPKRKDRPVVIIDPGHGGIDPGALGANNVPEKAIVLAVAQLLREELTKSKTFDVRLTRTTDVFVSLDRRVKFSQDNGADLFISLHADSIEEKGFAEAIRGATVYTLSERASDEQARKMADKENASDLIAGLDSLEMKAQDQVRNILIDLLKRETSNFSADFSNVLTRRLGKSIALSRDPQRSAAFKVLKQAHAPSVLVELGYLSNSQDQQQMTGREWQKKVAQSIAAAVEAYFGKRTAQQP